MRVEHIRLGAFGRLEGLDTGGESLGDLVVVLGPNEAGKSTFFHFLTTMLYGFHPATRDGNPYSPWNGADAEGMVRVKLDQGPCVEVERRLRSQPTGQLVVGGERDELRNRALPWAEHVPRQVFLQVFAITLSELAGLDDRTWEHIQDRVLGAMGSSELVPARALAATLEEEAGGLWRPTRRGNQRIRDVQERIRELQERKAAALQRDASLRALVQTIATDRARLEQAREERQRERVVVERLEALAPLRLRLRRIDEYLAVAGDEGELRGLPPDPGALLEELDSRIRELEASEAALAEARTEPTATIGSFTPQARSLAERREEVDAFLTLTSATAAERTRADDLGQEIGDLDRRLETAAAQLLAISWEQVPVGPLLALPVGELTRAVAELRSGRESRRVLEAAGERMAETPAGLPGFPPALPPAALGLGMVLLVVALLTGNAALAAAGGALAAAGGALLLLGRTGAASPAAEGDDPRLEAARTAEARAHDGVRTLLRDLPVRAELVEEPEGLAGGIQRIQELLRDRGERVRARDALTLRLAQVREEGERLSAALGRSGVDAWGLARVLDRDLRQAERLRQAAAAAERELARIDRERDRLGATLREVRDKRGELQERLRTLGGGSLEEGLSAAARRLEAGERARQLQDELERTVPDLEDLRARIAAAEEAGESWTRDDEDLAKRRTRIETLTAEIEETASRTEALERDLVHLQENETVDAVDGAIATLEEMETRLIEERDRRWILARLVRQADRRFREEHQPDLMRRAGDHLRHLTRGRYDRMQADDADGSERFMLAGPSLPEPLPLAPPLSTGTLEQAYFALRLAIVDHLDQGQERLPLFVDEALVNWDRQRRDRGLEVLHGLSRGRQLFVFTCHEDVAGALASRGARVLELGPVS